MRRGGVAFGQLIGGYFGVTESNDNGWSDVAQRRAEVHNYMNLLN